MSILSNLTGALEGAAGGTPAANATANPSAMVVSQIIALIQSRPGGLAGILQSFQQGGLGHLVQSWLGNGQNLPVSPDQLRGVLGSDWVSRITQVTGLSPAEVEQHAAAALPQIVDHLSPNGQLPQGEIGSALAGLAQRLLHS